MECVYCTQYYRTQGIHQFIADILPKYPCFFQYYLDYYLSILSAKHRQKITAITFRCYCARAARVLHSFHTWLIHNCTSYYYYYCHNGDVLHVQVLSLLEQMGLKKLQENFMSERVTGEILLECDDEVLYQELKVTNQSQQICSFLKAGWPYG